ncbi:hypothetical protein VaNZ11_007388 [Volvox africanus]|uniref:Integral membrane bound transporter domain-containing protein n=1 Tax=Volvox africanus TaxID=51714 RepID=A0ABQ5S3D3_9CHLO|nr:hypothetical protein VaNZ11_007388 [Volvox africanus]
MCSPIQHRSPNRWAIRLYSLTLARLAAPASCVSLVGCHAHTAALCCLGVAVLGLLVANRAVVGAPYPSHLWLGGLLGTIGYGIVVISGQFYTSPVLMWKGVVGNLLAMSLLGTGVCVVVSFVVLPSLALDEMRADTVAAVRGIGHAVSRIATRALCPENPGPFPARATESPSPSMFGPTAALTTPASPGLQGPHQEPAPYPPTHPGAAVERCPSANLPPISELQLVSQDLPTSRAPELLLQSEPRDGQVTHPSCSSGHGRNGDTASAVVGHMLWYRSQSSDSSPMPLGDPTGTFLPATQFGDINIGLSVGVVLSPQQAPPAWQVPELLQAGGGGQDHGFTCADRPWANPCNHRRSAGISRQHHMYDQLGSVRRDVMSAARSHTLPGHGVSMDTSHGTLHDGPASTKPPSVPPPPLPPPPPQQQQQTLEVPPAAAAAGIQPTYSCRIPGVASCPLLDPLDEPSGGDTAQSNRDLDKECGGRRHNFYASSSESSDDEPPLWGAQFYHELEGVMEDEDAFLSLLHEATAPQVPSSTPGAARRPPPPTAPPGGIRPSPSVVDMLHVPATGTSLAAVSKRDGKTKNLQHSHKYPLQAAVRDAKPQSKIVTIAGPGAGPVTAQSGGGLIGATVAWAPVSAIRPLLLRAKACAAAAALEPPWLGSGPADLAAWSRVLAGGEVLINRVGALECLLDGRQLVQGGQLLGASNLLTMLGADILAPYRRAYGQVAASCAAMSIALAASCEGRSLRVDGKQAPGPPAQLFVPVDWEESKHHLRNLVRVSLSAYWARVRGLGGQISGATPRPATGVLRMQPQGLHRRYHLQHFQRPRRGGRIPIMGLHQSRALNFLWTVTEGIVNAMDEMEAAVRELLKGKQDLATSRAPVQDAATDSAAACIRVATDAERGNTGVAGGSISSWGASRRSRVDSSISSDSRGNGDGGVGEGVRGGRRGPGSGDCFSNTAPIVSISTAAVPSHPSEARPGPKAAVSSIAMAIRNLLVQPTYSALGRVWCLHLGDWDWAWRAVQLALGIPLLLNTVSITATNTKLLLGAAGADGRRALLSCRRFHFGVKYWAASSFMLCLLLGLAARPDAVVLRRYSLLYAFLATSVSMTDRVESTFSRVALRAGGTLVGGALGLAVMMTPALNHNPAGIMTIVCAATFLTSCLSSHRLVYGAVLALITLHSMLLCSYGTSCCGSRLDVGKLFAARVVSVLLGSTLPVLVTQAVLPWFTSDWALEMMAGALMAAADLVRQLYRRYFEEHMRAYVESRGLLATAQLLRLHGLEEEATQLKKEEQEQQGASQAEMQQNPRDWQMQRDVEGQQLQVQLQSPPSSSAVEPGSSGGGRRDDAIPSVDPSQAAAAANPGHAHDCGQPSQGPSFSADVEVSLQAHVSGPLLAVQTSLMKDTAVWTRGIYATPMIVTAVLRCCLLLADRLEALQLVVVDTPPPVYGRLSGWGFAALVLPLHGEMIAMLSAFDRLVVATACLMDPDGEYRTPQRRNPGAASGGSAEGAGAELSGEPSRAIGPGCGAHPSGGLKEAIMDLDERRLQFRQAIHDVRRSFHAVVRSLGEKSEDLFAATHSDDTVRFHAFMFALTHVLDKATVTARTALQLSRGRVRRPGAWFAWSRG